MSPGELREQLSPRLPARSGRKFKAGGDSRNDGQGRPTSSLRGVLASRVSWDSDLAMKLSFFPLIKLGSFWLITDDQITPNAWE